MDIYEEYDEEDIEKIENIIENRIEENGIGTLIYEMLDAIAKISAENINKEYPDDEDAKEEIEEEIYEDYDEDDEKNPFVEEIESNDITLNNAIDIILKDRNIIEKISKELDESINCEEDFVPMKKQNIEILNGVIYLLYNINENTAFNKEREYLKNNNQLDYLKQVVAKKIKEMEYKDFIILMNNYEGGAVLLEDKYFKEIFIEKINKMNNAEFAYYLRKIDYSSSVNKEISEVEKKKAESANSSFIEYLYNISRKISDADGGLIVKDRKDAFVLDTMELYKYSSIHSILKEKQAKGNMKYEFSEISTEEINKKQEYKMYCTLLKKLNKKEFVCFMLRNGSDYLYEDEQKIVEQKLNEISREDLIILTNRLCFLELNFYEASDKENETILMKVAKRKGIVNENNEFICTSKEIKKASEDLLLYSDYTNNISIPVTIKREKNEEEEFNIEDLDDDERKEYEYNQNVNEIKEMVSIYKEIDRMCKLSDKEIIKIINQYNLYVNNEDAEGNLRSFTCFLEYKMLSLPAIYSQLFRTTGKGCLEAAMELKIDEARKEFEASSRKNNNGNVAGKTKLSEIKNAIEEQKRKRNTNNSGQSYGNQSNGNPNHDSQNK